MEILNQIAQETLSNNEFELLRLSLAGETTQSQLDSFLTGWDIEAAPIAEPMLLSYLMKMHPDLIFPESIRPRLSGLLNFSRYQFLNLVGHFGTYTRALRAQGIEFLIMKGGAMKALRPDFPRWMGDIDILVPEKDYHKAEEVARQCGYAIHHCNHSMDLSQNGQVFLDVHRFVLIFSGKERAINEDLFTRSIPTRVFSVDARMPSREDMLFMCLVNLVRNLAENSCTDSVLYSFFDVKFLLEDQENHPFNWSVVRENATQTDSCAYLLLAVRFLNGVVPGLLPEEKLENPGETAVKNLASWMGYRRYVLMRERAQLGDFNIIKTYRSGKPMIPYVWDRLCYLIHKGLQFCPSFCEHALKKHNYAV